MLKGITTAIIGLALLSLAPAANAICGGDCDASRTVTVDEVVLGVNMALGTASVAQCTAFDSNDDDQVTVDEILQAVNFALTGCPTLAGRYHSSVTLDRGRSGELDMTVQPDGSATGTLVISGGTRTINASVSLSGNVNFDTGSFAINGSFSSGGTTIPINVSGNLPSIPGLSGSVSFQIGVDIFNGVIGALTPTPTPSRTPTPGFPGTFYTIEVGQAGLPFDPEFLLIQPGDTVVWTWVGGSHSVVAGPQQLPIDCTNSGLFDSGVRTSGTFSRTFETSGIYTYHCGVPGHCENFESGYIEVYATPTPSRTPTQTFPPTPTATATPELVAGVSRAMIGIFSGMGHSSFGTDIEVRFQIRGENDNTEIRMTDLRGFVFGVNTEFRMNVVTPTKIDYHMNNLGAQTDITFDLTSPTHLSGVYLFSQMFMGSSTLTMEMDKEP